MSANPKRQPALGRVREPHPAATAAAAATTNVQPTTTARTRIAEPAAPPAPAEGTAQLNVRVPVSLRGRAERAALSISAQEGRRVPLQEVVISAVKEYLDARSL